VMSCFKLPVTDDFRYQLSVDLFNQIFFGKFSDNCSTVDSGGYFSADIWLNKIRRLIRLSAAAMTLLYKLVSFTLRGFDRQNRSLL